MFRTTASEPGSGASAIVATSIGSGGSMTIPGPIGWTRDMPPGP